MSLRPKASAKPPTTHLSMSEVQGMVRASSAAPMTEQQMIAELERRGWMVRRG
jgi:hypothetical protein